MKEIRRRPETVTRNQISKRLTEKMFLLNLDWKTASFIKEFFLEVLEELKDGNKVEIAGFGKFETARKNARKGIHPATGEPITIPASRVPKFTPYPAAKNAVRDEGEIE